MLVRHRFSRLVARSANRRRGFATSFNENRYGLNEEQVQLADQCDQFAEKEFKPHAAKWDEHKIFPVEALRKAASLGLGGMFVPEEHGGSNLSRFEGSIVYEALAKGCTSTTAYLSIHNMCAWMVSSFGNDDQRKRFLPQLISMDWFASYCLTEPSSGSDAGSLRTTAKKKGNEYVLNGTKAFISGGSASNIYLIMARSGTQDSGPKGVTCFAVEAGTKGLSFGAQEKKLGWNSQPTCMVILEDAVIPESNRFGQEGEGFKLAMKGLDGGRLAIGACSIGAAKACYDASLDHVKVRSQFGKPLAANQSIQFKLADMGTSIHLSRLAVRHAANLLDAKDPNATVHCAMAKKVATDMCFEVCDSAMQLFGGYGYLKDYPIERFMRDARVHRILEGTNEVQQMIMARDALK
jgi:alkylation response protein AidB-like acyl-CoA dehydrogenase